MPIRSQPYGHVADRSSQVVGSLLFVRMSARLSVEIRRTNDALLSSRVKVRLENGATVAPSLDQGAAVGSTEESWGRRDVRASTSGGG